MAVRAQTAIQLMGYYATYVKGNADLQCTSNPDNILMNVVSPWTPLFGGSPGMLQQ
jgi:hypothetical protein